MVASAQRMDFLTGKEFLNMVKRIFAALLTAALLTAGMAACSGQQQTVEEETVQLPADEEQQEAEPEQEGGDLEKQIHERTGASYRHRGPDADLREVLMQEVAVVPTTYFVDSQGKVVGEATLGARDKASWQQEIDARLAMLEE